MAEDPDMAGGKADINLAGYFNFFLRKEHAPDIGKYSKKWEKQGLYNSTAIRIADTIKMTGKGMVHLEPEVKDENDEDKLRPIIGPIYDYRMRQLAAREARKKYSNSASAYDFDA